MTIVRPFLLLSLIVQVVLLGPTGCTRAKSGAGNDSAQMLPIVARTTNAPDLATQTEQTHEGINIKPLNLPEDLLSAQCEINDETPVDCSGGFSMPLPQDGSYHLKLVVETVKGQRYVLEQDFQVRNGIWSTATDSIHKGDLTLSLAPENDFVNHGPVERTKGLKLKFDLHDPANCQARLWCSRSEGIWSLCHQDGSPIIDLEPREIVSGFQKISVKAQCPGSAVTSNILDYYWFGVDDNFKPLSLSKRSLPGLSHYQLIKQTDCLDKVYYECQEGQADTFIRCPNIKAAPSKRFGIRAVCDNGKDKLVGPVYLEN